MLAANGLVEIGRGVREAFNMGWQTFWALALGFLISGFLQQFVPKRKIERLFSNHRPAATARSAGFGVVSSSCSYAASALSRKLFQLGADFVASLIFMVASTNLVIELGIVLAVLIGWQFVLGEFVGGAVMIIIMATIGGVFFSSRLIAKMRSQPEDNLAVTEADESSPEHESSVVDRITGAFSFAISDLAMLKKEIVGGLLAAGILAKVVPTSWWTTIFLHGHGTLADVENGFVGPIVAMIACVCSVGNVPLAATLWNEGIGFGGVLSFIFADLLAIPLLFTYRRYYGTKITLRIAGLLYVSMVSGALLLQGFFAVLRIEPRTHHLAIFSTNAKWGVTTTLDIVFFVLLVIAYLAHRASRKRIEESPYAIDPICHMRVEKQNAAAKATIRSVTSYFCSQGCADHFIEKNEIDTTKDGELLSGIQRQQEILHKK